MQIMGLLGMYFDAAVVFVPNFSLLFRLFKCNAKMHQNEITEFVEALSLIFMSAYVQVHSI
jgi:hypothetical protein